MKRSTSTLSRLANSLILVAALGTAFAADSPLVGVWQLDSEPSAQAGLYLFTPTHYSMVLAATDRPDVADTNKATADELRALWGPLLANAGTYEISGDLLTDSAHCGEDSGGDEGGRKRSLSFPHRGQDADASAGAQRAGRDHRSSRNPEVQSRGMRPEVRFHLDA